MQFETSSQVRVAIDVLETEAIYAECVKNTLEVIRLAAEYAPSDIGGNIGGACWLLGQVMSMHEDTLRSAARGELSGPPERGTEGGAA